MQNEDAGVEGGAGVGAAPAADAGAAGGAAEGGAAGGAPPAEAAGGAADAVPGRNEPADGAAPMEP